ncbi:hypothetical protein J2Z50_005504 [Ensifer mexicanus]|nr:hypothetical protein [Sinorhizobium mexicanum]
MRATAVGRASHGLAADFTGPRVVSDAQRVSACFVLKSSKIEANMQQGMIVKGRPKKFMKS